jgi:hypothetical protein
LRDGATGGIRKEHLVAEKTTFTIELTNEQQIELLAATGLRARILLVEAASLDEGGAATASIPLPRWLIESVTDQ